MTIKDMLRNGATPDDLLKEINKAQRELDAEKAAEQEKKEKEKRVAAAREKVVQAMKEYSKEMYGMEPDITLMDNFNKDLTKIEQAVKPVTVSDDERLKRFLRGVLA